MSTASQVGSLSRINVVAYTPTDGNDSGAVMLTRTGHARTRTRTRTKPTRTRTRTRLARTRTRT